MPRLLRPVLVGVGVASLVAVAMLGAQSNLIVGTWKLKAHVRSADL